jgi:hypothetical protein
MHPLYVGPVAQCHQHGIETQIVMIKMRMMRQKILHCALQSFAVFDA